MFSWMYWTFPVAVFFISIGLILLGMTVWEIRSPSPTRKGFLPIATTRGDRLFIGLVSVAYINLIFVGVSGQLMDIFLLESEPSVWVSFAISIVFFLFTMRKG